MSCEAASLRVLHLGPSGRAQSPQPARVKLAAAELIIYSDSDQAHRWVTSGGCGHAQRCHYLWWKWPDIHVPNIYGDSDQANVWVTLFMETVTRHTSEWLLMDVTMHRGVIIYGENGHIYMCLTFMVTVIRKIGEWLYVGCQWPGTQMIFFIVTFTRQTCGSHYLWRQWPGTQVSDIT